MKTNYHSHSTYCDGQNTMEDMAQEAFTRGFQIWGISSHSPVPFPSVYNMPSHKLPYYEAGAQRLKTQYFGKMEILLGMEVEYFHKGPHRLKDSGFSTSGAQLDYRLGAIHFIYSNLMHEYRAVDGSMENFQQTLFVGYEGDIKKLAKDYYRAIPDLVKDHHPEMLAHFDLIKKNNGTGTFFNESDKWYQDLVMDALEALADTDTVMEINTGGLARGRCPDFYPSFEILRKAQDLGVKITINTDCHHRDLVDALYSQAIDRAKEAGFRECWHLSSKGWFSTAL